MHFPTILHSKDGAKVKVENQEEYDEVIKKGWRESPADFTPEAEAARKKREAEEKELEESRRAHDERVAKGLKLLEEKEEQEALEGLGLDSEKAQKKAKNTKPPIND